MMCNVSPCFIKQAALALTETVTESFGSGVNPLNCTFLTVPQISSHFQRKMQTMCVLLPPVLLACTVYPSVCHFKSIWLNKKREGNSPKNNSFICQILQLTERMHVIHYVVLYMFSDGGKHVLVKWNSLHCVYSPIMYLIRGLE